MQFILYCNSNRPVQNSYSAERTYINSSPPKQKDDLCLFFCLYPFSVHCYLLIKKNSIMCSMIEQYKNITLEVRKHRRRINTKEKAEVVASVWGEEFIQFLAYCRTILKNRINSFFSFKSSWCNSSFNSNCPLKNS